MDDQDPRVRISALELMVGLDILAFDEQKRSF
jgi:hypothetical protein